MATETRHSGTLRTDYESDRARLDDLRPLTADTDILLHRLTEASREMPYRDADGREGTLTPRDALCSISLLGLAHSLIEDTILLALLGGSLWGLLGFRLVFTLSAGALLNFFYPALARFAVARA